MIGKEVMYLQAVSAYFKDKIVDFGTCKGYIPGGVNGPYFDVETPVRNSAHSLLIFSLLYKQSGNEHYKKTAENLANFLLEPKFFCRKGVYIHRQKKGKDWCNGVIGQAWVIEALNIAGTLLADPNLRLAAQKAASIFAFDKNVKAWEAKDPGSKLKKIDYTLNHQLWYAAAVAEIDSPQHLRQVSFFLDHLADFGLQVRANGLVNHQLFAKSLKSKILRSRYELGLKRKPNLVLEKEIGYHLYNLFPLARLYKILPSHPLFQSPKFAAAIKYCQSNEFLEALTKNKYAFPYNSPSFEYPLVIKSFSQYFRKDKIKEIEDYIWSPINLFSITTDGKGITLKNDIVPDAITLMSRAYELVFCLLDT